MLPPSGTTGSVKETAHGDLFQEREASVVSRWHLGEVELGVEGDMRIAACCGSVGGGCVPLGDRACVVVVRRCVFLGIMRGDDHLATKSAVRVARSPARALHRAWDSRLVQL